MGTVSPFERRPPRIPNATRRPCACPDCRRCDTCKQLIAAIGGASEHCSFSNCPMKGAATVEEVLKEFAQVVFALPAARKKKP